jgi:Family of unknown function (DUF5338)
MAKMSGIRRIRGTARVAFVALMDIIVTELELGYTAVAIYERNQIKLRGSISYPQFARYVRQLRDDGVVKPPLGRSTEVPATLAPQLKPKPNAPPISQPQPAAAERREDARHHPFRNRGFNHDAIERPDDRKRLLGED